MPAAALAELGVPQAVIHALPTTSVAPMQLASQQAFADALEHLKRGDAEVALCQSAPQVNLSISARTDPAGDLNTPFAAS